MNDARTIPDMAASLKSGRSRRTAAADDGSDGAVARTALPATPGANRRRTAFMLFPGVDTNQHNSIIDLEKQFCEEIVTTSFQPEVIVFIEIGSDVRAGPISLPGRDQVFRMLTRRDSPKKFTFFTDRISQSYFRICSS